MRIFVNLIFLCVVFHMYICKFDTCICVLCFVCVSDVSTYLCCVCVGGWLEKLAHTDTNWDKLCVWTMRMDNDVMIIQRDKWEGDFV